MTPFISEIWGSIQSYLFPMLEEELGQLSPKQQQFTRVCEFCDLEHLLAPYDWSGQGRPPSSRLSIARAFIAKAVYNCATTRVLIDLISQSPSLRRLCGWETRKAIPSEPFAKLFC